jgi:hypothetical protein
MESEKSDYVEKLTEMSKNTLVDSYCYITRTIGDLWDNSQPIALT